MTDSNNSVKQKAIQQILRLAPHTEIAHHIPGRIRLKILVSGVNMARDLDFDAIARQIPGLLNAKAKVLSRSVVIDYDPRRLPPDLWEELGRVRARPELMSMLAERLQSLIV
jgi:hypothetical protein